MLCTLKLNERVYDWEIKNILNVLVWKIQHSSKFNKKKTDLVSCSILVENEQKDTLVSKIPLNAFICKKTTNEFVKDYRKKTMLESEENPHFHKSMELSLN